MFIKQLFKTLSIFICFLSGTHRCFAQNSFPYSCEDITHDFIGGEDVIFQDDFRNEKPGDYPLKWKPMHNHDTIKGIIKIIDGLPAFDFQLSTGYLASPKFEKQRGIDTLVTLEFDYILKDKNAAIGANFLFDNGEWRLFSVNYHGDLFEQYLHNPDDGKYEILYSGQLDSSKWHHFAVSFTQKEIKCFIDNKKIYMTSRINNKFGRPTNERCDIPKFFIFSGRPLLSLRNVRFAETKLKPIGPISFDKIITDKKFVTHAILFDVNKAIIKPESIDFIKQLSSWLQKNPNIKLEIDGHTDSDGTKEGNIILSKHRAEAVKNMLISLGIQKARLSTKGFGANKPIDSNATPEGKANNRRVEFINL